MDELRKECSKGVYIRKALEKVKIILYSNLEVYIKVHYQMKSFLTVYEAVKTTINDQVGWWGYLGRVTSV